MGHTDLPMAPALKATLVALSLVTQRQYLVISVWLV